MQRQGSRNKDVSLSDCAEPDASSLPWVEGSKGRPVQAGNNLMQGQVHDKPKKGSKDKGQQARSLRPAEQPARQLLAGSQSKCDPGANAGQLEQRNELIIKKPLGDCAEPDVSSVPWVRT